MALSFDEILDIVGCADPERRRAARERAYALKTRLIGRRVSMRGLVEAGNRCRKDCFYCGIRASNRACPRYSLSVDEIALAAEKAAAAGYGSVVIQSGELESEANTAFFEETLRRIAPLDLGVTLSLGEQSEETFRRWKAAGASRYLLRIETSDRELYRKLHPADHSFDRRVECLRALKRAGYQTGTGVMIGLPGQTLESLARDILFFAEIDVDMIGMGPYIPHPLTPLAALPCGIPPSPRFDAAAQLELALDMIAAARLHLGDVNIAATTALQALAPDGRERGILAGANVIMPNVTDVKWRENYRLYEGKPEGDENALAAREALERSLAAIGESIRWNERGDSLHFFERTVR